MNQPVRPPLGDPLDEAIHYLNIYFHPASEGGRAWLTALAEMTALRRQLADVTAARGALRDGAAVGDENLPQRLHSAAELLAGAGAARTSTALHATAHRLEDLPPHFLDALTRHVLHGPPAAADTEQETTQP